MKSRLLKGFGWLFVLSEVLWITWWFSIVVQGIRSHRWPDVDSGYSCLTSPHSGMLLYIAASTRDLGRHCSATSETCDLSTPAYLWYAGPLVVIPFDILQLMRNVETGARSVVLGASSLTLANSCMVFIWSTSIYLSLVRQSVFGEVSRSKKVSVGSGALRL